MLVIPFSNNPKDGYHQMVNTKLKFIMPVAGKNGEALYNQQKQDTDLTVAQMMDSLL